MYLKTHKKYTKIYTGVFLFVGAVSIYSFVEYWLYNSTTTSEGDLYAVEMMEQGFAPNEIVIQQGDTVVWKNTGTRNHWPASNFHPTHTMYPDSDIRKCGSTTEQMLFDSCTGIEFGETYSFTFTHAGIWHYHDHLSPSLTGTVHVVSTDDSSNETQNMQKENLYTSIPKPEMFRTLSDNDQATILHSISKDDPKGGWEYIKEAFLVDGQVVGNAHELAHIVGNNAYRKNGFDGIKICDPTFAYGCYHGITEQFLLTEGSGGTRMAMEKCRETFSPNKQGGELPYYSCVHGLGHGLLTWNNLNLKKALIDCDRLDDTEQSYCYDGVFMEFSFSTPQNYYLHAQNPWKMCTELGEQYAMECARYLPILLGGTLSKSTDDTMTLCAQAPTETLRGGCIDRLGFTLAYEGPNAPENIQLRCGAIKDEIYNARCVTAAAGELVFQQYQNAEKNAGKLCTSLPAPWQGQCTEHVETIIGTQ
jgi:plastocyanin